MSFLSVFLSATLFATLQTTHRVRPASDSAALQTAHRVPSATDDTTFWYTEINEPFFISRDSGEGRRVFISQRPRARELQFIQPKPTKTFRIFILGGSVAIQYDASPQWNGGWTLEKIVGRLLPDYRVEVLNCGVGGYDSYRESLILKEVLGYSPDLIILMSGNNEPPQASGRPSITAWAALRMRQFLGLQAAPGTFQDKGGRPHFLEEFRANLERMVAAARDRHVPILLTQNPAQIGMLAGALPMGNYLFFQAWAEWERGNLDAAQEAFQLYSLTYPGEGFGYDGLSRILRKKGQPAEVRELYRKNRGQIASSMPQVHAIIREVAAKYGVMTCDLADAFNSRLTTPYYDQLFRDSTHWNGYADPLVSLALAKVLVGQAADLSFGPSLNAAWLKSEGASLAPERPNIRELENTRLHRAATAIWTSADQAPRFSESSLKILESIEAEDPRWLARAPQFKGQLHELVITNAYSRGRADDFDRRWAWGLAHIGETYRRLGRPGKALSFFDEALRLDPAIKIIPLQKALAWRALGQPDKARRQLASLANLEPEFPEIRFYAEELAPGWNPAPRRLLVQALLGVKRGTSEAARGKLGEAMKEPRSVMLCRRMDCPSL